MKPNWLVCDKSSQSEMIDIFYKQMLSANIVLFSN